MLFTTWFGTDLFIVVERSKDITQVKLLPSLVAKMLDICDVNIIRLLPTSQAFWKTRRPDEAADYRAARRYVYAKKISETLKSVE